MRKVLVDSIKGDEILAQDILSCHDTILMVAGIHMKVEYISKLKELDIHYVYIEDELAIGVHKDEVIEQQIKNQSQQIIVETIEKYTYYGNQELKKLTYVAENIIMDILKRPEVMYNINDIRSKSESIYSHSLNVCTLSVLVAIKIGLTTEEIKDIAIGSLLHDIGLSYLNSNGYNIEYDKLEEKQKKQCKMHVINGYSQLEKETWLNETCKDIILSHHENIDGSGYPFHAKGEKIKLTTAIVSVCDSFDCLVYGFFCKKIKVHQAIDYIISQSDTKFHYTVVRAFHECVAAYPNGSVVITNDSQVGIVLRQNKKCPTRPVIRLIKDNNGKQYKDWVERDLTKELTMYIMDTIE